MKIAVVIPVRMAARTVAATVLDALSQCRGLDAEAIVVVSELDPSAAIVSKMDDPQLRVLVKPGRRSVPQLRRDGVFATDAEMVVITEDHCRFPDGWLRGLVEAMQKHSVAVSGGGVENGRRSLTGWAQYFTRYSAFLPPVREGHTKALPGNNACYTREIIERHRALLTDGFWEAEFNHELPGDFWIAASLAVVQHQHRGVFEYIPLRYRHGRCYGARRGAGAKLILQAPLIPALLFFRAARAVLRKRRHVAEFLLVSPLLAIYFAAWGAGEFVGYLFGAGDSCSDTD